MRRRFIAITTGQAVANLPPILQWGEPGDGVVWLETSEARRNPWRAGASSVLERHGLAILDPVAISDDPSSIAATIGKQLGGWQDAELVLVGNGGIKPVLLAVHEALQNRATLLYGMDRPVELRSFDGGLSAPHRRHDYTFPQGALTLQDVLECTGHLIQNPADAQRFWPGPQPSVRDADYGRDVAYTVACHDQAYVRSVRTRRLDDDSVSFDAVAELAPDVFQGWLNGLQSVINAAQKHAGRRGREHVFPEALLRPASGVYHGALKLQRRASAKVAAGEATGEPVQPLGLMFEDAVAARLYDWLQGRPETARFVQSAWRRVKFSHRLELDKVVAEHDVLLVLRNGILLSLECKSFETNVKDLDARLFNLHESASRLASMAVCSPVYTGYIDREWFSTQTQVRERIRKSRSFTHIPFTLPGQPKEFRRASSGVIVLNEECPSFEEAIVHWLKPYHPLSAP